MKLNKVQEEIQFSIIYTVTVDSKPRKLPLAGRKPQLDLVPMEGGTC